MSLTLIRASINRDRRQLASFLLVSRREQLNENGMLRACLFSFDIGFFRML